LHVPIKNGRLGLAALASSRLAESGKSPPWVNGTSLASISVGGPRPIPSRAANAFPFQLLTERPAFRFVVPDRVGDRLELGLLVCAFGTSGERASRLPKRRPPNLNQMLLGSVGLTPSRATPGARAPMPAASTTARARSRICICAGLTKRCIEHSVLWPLSR